MSANKDAKPYGIIVNMPENDPMSAPHLLGESWVAHRWYNTEEQRDIAYDDMLRHPSNFRKGDKPSVQLTKVDPDA